MISLIIPLYNEEEIIENNVKKVLLHFSRTPLDFELILVNDASTDSSLSKIQGFEAENVKIVTYDKNHGKGYALKQGMKVSLGDYVFFTDADLAYGLDCIIKAYELFEKTGADLVIGSRKLDRDGYNVYTPIRKLMSYTFRSVSNLTLKLKLSDSQCGLKGFRGDIGRELFEISQTERFGIDFELLYLARQKGYKIEEMAVRILHHGKTSVHPIKDSINMLRELFVIRDKYRRRKK